VGKPSGCQDHSESVVRGAAEAAGDPAVEFDDAVDRFGAAVAGASGGEEARNCSFQARSVRPRRAISGMGQLGNDSSTFTAMARPSARLLVWYADRSCW
jgi:hypothetical protein